MIHITDKHNCCGCSACVNACPKACITMQADGEGFLYPQVDIDTCIDCSLCEKACPFLSEQEPKLPLNTYAAINPNEKERLNSSSGGIFTMLMRETINSGGVVYGAAFDEEWNVHHTKIENLEDTSLLQGSKYVQSHIGDCYKTAKEYLNQGRKVLFSGTACQIAGLKRYLHKNYDNLLTVDVVCHGVPSPLIWKDYLGNLQKQSSISNISFRDKCTGWSDYSLTVEFQDSRKYSRMHHDDLYMKGFLHNLYLRPSCHNCQVKGGRCNSDITLGDFWGVENILPNLNDDKGISLVFANTKKVKDVLDVLGVPLKKVTYDVALRGNPCLEMSTSETDSRSLFWELYNNSKDLTRSIKQAIKRNKPSLLNRALSKLKRIL